MKINVVSSIVLGCCVVMDALAGQKWGESVTKTYENSDGSTYSVSVKLNKKSYASGSGSGKNTENASIGGTSHHLNIIAYNKDGEVIGENFYFKTRVTYVADENDSIVGIKSCWDCAIVETFKYTDSDKLLVYGTNGKLKGTYDSLADYHVTNVLGMDSYKGTPNGKAQYIDHSLNLISEDGCFYDYDSNNKLKGVYYADGNFNTYDYQPNGDYKLYGTSGEFLGNFMENGQKRRIYNIEEATAVVNRDKNTFKVWYR